MGKVSATIYVSGIVQGVGYRFFTERVANELGLVGYVMNLSDGRVKVYVEGDKEVIEELIKELWKGPRAAIVDDVEVEWGEYTGKYKTFKITYEYGFW